jgi:hypothetical protein
LRVFHARGLGGDVVLASFGRNDEALRHWGVGLRLERKELRMSCAKGRNAVGVLGCRQSGMRLQYCSDRYGTIGLNNMQSRATGVQSSAWNAEQCNRNAEQSMECRAEHGMQSSATGMQSREGNAEQCNRNAEQRR